MKTTLLSLAFALISILSFGQGLTISGSVGFTSCSTANISITVNNSATGPYRYKLADNILINSPLEAINSAASTITFSYACQPGTTYYAEVRDATDEVRVLTFQIPSSSPLNFVFPGTTSCNPDATLNVVRLRCDSIQIRGLSFSPSFNGGFTNGFPNYQVQLIDLSANGSVIENTFTNLTLNQINNLPIKLYLPLCPREANNKFTARVIVTDACGQKDTLDLVYPRQQHINLVQRYCGNAAVTWTGDDIIDVKKPNGNTVGGIPAAAYFNPGYSGSIGVAYYIAGTNTRIDTTNFNVTCLTSPNVVARDTVPYGCYDIYLTDGCCRRKIETGVCFNAPNYAVPPTINIFPGCMDSTAAITYSNTQRAYPITHVLDSGRVNFSTSSNLFNLSAIASPAVYPYSTTYEQNAGAFGGLPAGTYRLVEIDACGHRDTSRITISPTQTRKRFKIKVYTPALCDLNNNTGAIYAALEIDPADTYQGFRFFLKDDAGNILKSVIRSFSAPYDTIKFDLPNAGLNLTPGGYTVEYESIRVAGFPIFADCPARGSKGIKIEEYKVPVPKFTVTDCRGSELSSIASIMLENIGGGVEPFDIYFQRITPTPGAIVTSSGLRSADFPYNFNYNVGALNVPTDFRVLLKDSCGNGRLDTITLIDCRLLPLKILEFDANKVNTNTVTVTWKISESSAISRFEIERSSGNSWSWEKVGTLSYLGDGDYSFLDANIPETNLFYRLKVIEVDGHFTYSAIKALTNNSSQAFAISVYPSPSSGNITVKSTASIKLLRVYDYAGKIVQYQSFNLGEKLCYLNLTTLPKSVYMLEVVNRDGVSEFAKIILN